MTKLNAIQRALVGGIAILTMAMQTLWSGGAGAAETLAPYRLSHVTAYPATAVATHEITVDGDLGEWRPEAFQTIFQDPGSRDLRSCSFALAYNDQGLYVAMDIADDTPMENVIDPLADPFRGWRGDSIQMRFIAPGKQITHWTWWYFTERDLPAVDVRYGTGFSDPVTLTGDAAQLKYRKRDGGCTFELLMPWKLLNATGPGGGEWRTVIEPHFNVFGEEVIAFSDCIVREENALYQRTHLWGELRFATAEDAGQRLAEQAAIEKQRDRFGRKDAPTWGMPLRFSNPAEGFVSLAVADAEGRNVRTILARAKRQQGELTEYWDGLDDDGNPVPAGRYSLKALTHPGITPRFVTSVMNSGNPPWITADGKGSWGADHGNPIDAAAGTDGSVYLLWSGGEAGFSLIGVDGTGQKQWGAKLPFGGHSVAVTVDVDKVYVAEPGKLLVYNAATGASSSFSDNRSEIAVGNWPDAGSAISGLAAAPDALYVALAKPGKILALDKQTFVPRKSWELAGAGPIAYDARANLLYALAQGQVWKLDPAGNNGPVPFVSDGLDSPAGIAVDRKGNLYVAQQGSRHCVAVYNERGRLRRTIGKEGGRPRVGKFDPEGMLNPTGICVDSRGHLWVTENDNMPRRISQWDAGSGKFRKDFFGSSAYAVMMAPDPEQPEHVYLHNCRFIVDYEAGTSRPDATVWRGKGPHYGFMGGTLHVSRYLGKTFAYNGADQVLSYGDSEFTPLVQVGGRQNNIFQFGGTLFPGASLIRDKRVFRPQGLTPEGAPIYPAAADASPVITGDGPMNRYSNWMDVWPSFESDWYEFYAIASLPDTKFGGIPDGGGGDGIFHFTRDGEILWRYPNVRVFYAIKDQRLAGPGDLMGAVRIVGLVNMPPEQGGEIVGIGCYRGYFGLVAGNGLFIDKIGDDKGKGLPPNFDTFYIENFSGYLFKHPKTGKVYLFCGDVDARILELQGLENIQCFDAGTVELAKDDVQRLTIARAEARRNQAVAATELTVVRVSQSPEPVQKAFPAAAMQRIELDEQRSALVGLARDDANLYAMFNVDDPSPWKNGASDWKLLFKGGDAVDVQLGPSDGTAFVRVFVAPGLKDDEFFVVGMWPQTPKGMDPAPETYKSPVGQESFGRVAKLDNVKVQLRRNEASYTAVIAIPWKDIGMAAPTSGDTLRADLGVLLSDPSGSRTIRRRYLFNTETGIVDDIPSEVRLRPQHWGNAKIR